jgi:hypothetical protein
VGKGADEGKEEGGGREARDSSLMAVYGNDGRREGIDGGGEGLMERRGSLICFDGW